MPAHNWLDSIGCLISVVKWDGGNVVVKNVGLDDAVKEGTANETEFAVDGSSCPTDVIPALTSVVRKSWISVLEEGDSNYKLLVDVPTLLYFHVIYIPSQWLTHRYGAKYQTAMLAKPNLWQRITSPVITMARPRSLRRMSLASLAS